MNLFVSAIVVFVASRRDVCCVFVRRDLMGRNLVRYRELQSGKD